MAVPDIPMLGFRAQQAVMDLRATAGRQPRNALRAVADRVPPASRNGHPDAQTLARIVLRQGARLERAEDRPLIDALLLAASQPDTDPAAFVLATAVLLADRIQLGEGWDDLGHYWSTYHAAYARLDPHDRAAIIQGFLTGAALGRVRMPPPEAGSARLTQQTDLVRGALLALARRDSAQVSAGVQAQLEPMDAAMALPHLRNLLTGTHPEPLTGDSLVFAPLLALASRPRDPGFAGATALLLAQAVLDHDREGWFSVTLWQERAADWLRLPPAEGRPILAALRYLYESDPAWVPEPDRLASLSRTAGLPLLPVLDVGFGPGSPGARAG